MKTTLGIAGLLILLAVAAVAQPSAPVDSVFGGSSFRYFDRPVDPDLYLMRPGDELRVTFIDAQLPSLTLTLDPEVRVIDRTLGVFSLAGKTLAQASAELREVLSKLYHVDQIIISVTAPRKVGVQVSGAVNRPGLYVVYTSQRVSEAVDSAGGLRSDASHRFISLRGGPLDVAVDLDRAFYLGEDSQNSPLYAGYTVYVPSRRDQVVNVVGEVNTPREIELVTGDSVGTLLRLAGGLRATADPSKIVILRGAKELPAAENSPQAGDIIVVPVREDRFTSEGLVVFGSVNRPGRYDFQDGETLRSLIDRAGGFAADAAPDGMTIFRQAAQTEDRRYSGVRFPIGNLLTRDGKIGDVAIKPLDSIFVPAAIGLVRISGDVRNPGTYPFTANQPASFYIAAAGGLLPTAEKSRVNIFKRISRITGEYPPEAIVHDGDEVIVPRREELK